MSFDDGINRVYRDGVVEGVQRLLDEAVSEPAVFTAATATSFAEAEHAYPDPASEGDLVELARRRTGNYDRGGAVALGPRITQRSRPLAQILDRRQSQRDVAPPTLDDLATVMIRSARVIDWTYDDRGIETSYRPSPSAGALHPLAIHVIADQVLGLDRGRWEFDPFRCELIPSTCTVEAIERTRRLIAQAANVDAVPACFVLVANPARTLQRYPRGTAHIWRDAGVLLATLHLVASDLGLASSIIGTSGVLDQFDPAGHGIVDVGSLVIGRQPPE